MSANIEYLPKDSRTIHQVAEWLFSEWGHLIPGRTLDDTEQRLSRRAGGHTVPLALIAREDGCAVGTASLVAADMGIRTNLSPWLGAVFVRPTFRGHGLGSALCRQMIEEVRRLGYHRVYLYTPNRQSFYKALGWDEFETSEYRGQLVTIMTYDLDRARNSSDASSRGPSSFLPTDGAPS